MATRTPIITLEEHFMSAAAAAEANNKHATIESFKKIPGLWEKFTELGPLRLTDMDAGQVSLQVISHGPGDLTPNQCRSANAQLAQAVQTHPARFAGLAALPMRHPAEAATELRRTCSRAEAKFLGALVDSHTDSGTYYEGQEYDVLWQAASELDVPIYIHPTWPSEGQFSTYKSNAIAPEVSAAIAAFSFGWHSDVAVHILRLYAGGVFDRFPNLKIVIGHFGEMIPFMLQRIERTSSRWGRTRSFREVWDQNVWLTTSGNWALDPLACILRNTKKDRVMYSVDYPFASSEDGLRWLEGLEGSGMVSEEELGGIRWRNAARLLKVEVKMA
ncbi:amidohydrolase 2 [Diaporthe helianthi]|uniref:Amidohydrolase 2 n=1 Tax=Diaporthe helianthi TaxID=158607 RepID=A0A2P5IBV6_DIAHE|nr:amidohydrolase 2 [Diaporthe helianthi]